MNRETYGQGLFFHGNPFNMLKNHNAENVHRLLVFSAHTEQDGLEFPDVSRNHAHKAEKGSVASVALGRPC